MDAKNGRPTEGAEPAMETSDWRAQLQPGSRPRIINKIMDTLKRHLSLNGHDGFYELQKIAQRFEEKIYTAATSQSDYLRKISLKMLTMDNISQTSGKAPDSGLGMQPHVHNPRQLHPNHSANQPSSQQQLLSQNIQNNNETPGVQSSSGLAPSLQPVSNLTQTPIQNVVGQNSSMQNISGQNTVGSTFGQGVPSSMLASSQRQMPGRQQVVPQQQQRHSQNQQQFLLQQQQLQQQMMKHKLQQGNIPHSLMQTRIQQQQPHQNLLQPNQLQSSRQSVVQTSSVMQPSMIQSSSLSSLQQNQQSNNVQQSTQSMLQQHPQSVMRQQQQQTSTIHQQQTSMTHPQQQQQLLGQQSSTTNMQHAQLLGQQNSVGDMQQQQRLLGQQNNLTNLQQHQQQLINQQNNLLNIHQQQLGGNVAGLQQQKLLGTQSGNTGMQGSQHSAHMLQQSRVPVQQQSQQSASSMLASQGQKSQPQAAQQQLMPQIQSQPPQLQQQRLQASGSSIQQPNVLDQQKQFYHSQRALPDTPSTSLDSAAQTGQPSGGDCLEEVYEKIKAMKESYLPELHDIYLKVAAKLRQHDALPQQPKSDQLEKLKMFKQMLERMVAFLQIPRSSIQPNLKEKLGSYEKQIINLINTNRPRKAMTSQSQGQLAPPHMHSMQQPQSQVSQDCQVQSHEKQTNSQLQSTNLQGSIAIMPQNTMNSMQPDANLDSGQGNDMNSLQQDALSSLQQNPVSSPQQTNINSLSSQGGVSLLQPNVSPLQPGSSMLQNQQMKQQQEQHMLQNQQLKQQYQQRQIQQHLMQRQKLQQKQQQPQQLHQGVKQLSPAQSQTHQLPQLHQMNDMNDVKMRQGIGIKSGVFQPHLSSGQHSAYPHQPAGPFPVSSPQLLQAASPQIPQHNCPQVEQQNILPSLTKAGTPLQSVNSPFVVPTPSSPLTLSPMPADSEKPMSVVSSISNAANNGHQQTGTTAAPAQSLAIVTPGVSASPLLAEFSSQDGAHGITLAATSGKSTVTEQPLERLIKAVNSLSPKLLSAAVNDVVSVVSMTDRIAGSAPGNGSRAAVGEDLIAMTSSRQQARNVITQDGINGTKRMRCYTNALPLNVVSSSGNLNESIKQLTISEAADLESTATSSVKKPRREVNHALLEEIKEINRRLIDTVMDISDEDVDPTAAAAEGDKGTVVKCSFSAVALSPNLKSQYASAQMSPIQSVRLLVPTNYPNCSPILLDKFPVESSKENEDLSVKAKSRFGISLRGLSQPMSLGEIARTWDVCARAAISEYAQQSGGGSFSSKYGTWESLSAAS